MKTNAILPLLLLAVLAGCLQQRITYICPDGSVANSTYLCPPVQHPEPPTEAPAQEAPTAVNETPAPEPPPEAPPNISCYKQGGDDRFSQSIAVLRSDSTVLQQGEDVCLSPSDLKEFYCDGDEMAYTTYACGNGCEGGRCNRELVRSECNDTDGGGADHLYLRGQIIYRDYYSDGSTEERTLVEDYCDGTTLNEYSCPSPESTVHFGHSELACLGCADGACPHPYD
ncbi:MAG: hypothetical protein PHY95_02245 [Candidatus ainarchaeum sp.]|nr:hypothetical protein [Candidatus ainarchaeum sp.]